jgi:Secretion system C-terminal sorting domain
MRKILLLAFSLFISILSIGQCPTTTITLLSQADVDTFAATYPGCTELINSLVVNAIDVTNLNGLIQLESSTGNSDIRILNTVITDLSGLDNLQTVGGNLELEANQLLINFNGLEQLESIHTDFILVENGVLSSFDGLSSLVTIGGALRLRNNPTLENFSGMDNLSTLGIEGVNNTNARGLDIMSSYSFSSFVGLENLTEVNGSVLIFNNSNLQNLMGLENVTQIASALQIDNNDDLLNLQGLNSLETIGFTLRIQQNDQLLTLEGLEGLQEFSSSLSMTFNNSLNSIEALSNVMTISAIGFIAIKNNPGLSFCAIEVICAGITSTSTVVEIEDNATGCNTVPEVESDCNLAVSELYLTAKIALYPNPVSSKLKIRTSEGIVLQKAVVYSILGEELIFTSEETVDFSKLSTGIYFVEVLTDRGSVTKKIVKE